MDTKTPQIIDVFTERLKEKLGNQLRGVILFGSHARGDFHNDSDYDVIVLVDKKSDELRQRIRDIAWSVGWEYEASISPFISEEKRFSEDHYEPLFINVRREGLRGL